MALAQLFYLREAVKRRARNMRDRWARGHVPQPRSFALEPLEGRILLSADLTGVVTAHTLLDPSVPTNAEQATIRVLNQGATATNQGLAAGRLCLARQYPGCRRRCRRQRERAQDHQRLPVQGCKRGASDAEYPRGRNLQPAGPRVDTNRNVVVEGMSGEAKNPTVGPQFQVAWQFGAVPGRAGNTT